MPTGLIVLCLITVPLALGLALLGRHLRTRGTPLSRIRSPGGGLITDRAELLAATRRMGGAALALAAALLVITAAIVWQDWQAGRISAPAMETER